MKTNSNAITAHLLEDDSLGDDTFDRNKLKPRILASAKRAEIERKKRRCNVCGEPLMVGHWTRVYEFLYLTYGEEDAPPMREEGDVAGDNLEITCSSAAACVDATTHLSAEDKEMFYNEFYNAD